MLWPESVNGLAAARRFVSGIAQPLYVTTINHQYLSDRPSMPNLITKSSDDSRYPSS